MVISYEDCTDPRDAFEMKPFNAKCVYCGNPLFFQDIEKVTNYGFADFKESVAF